MKPSLRIAQELCVLYHEAIRSEVAKLTKAKRVVRTRTLDDVDKPARRAFITAARSCIELGADARDFVIAQFSTWREASTYHKKLLWPSPHHFATLAARIRYLQHKGREEIRVSRVASKNEDTDEKRRWYVEERQLKGLARVQRRDPLEVLTEQPERFSRDFLKHRDVWDTVKDLWEERTQR